MYQTTPISQSTRTITTSASNRNGKVHMNLLREPSILVMLKNWSSGTWSKASGRATVGAGIGKCRTDFYIYFHLLTLQEA